MNKNVIILSPHRSGSSLLARILIESGFSSHDNTNDVDEFNLSGYNESQKLLGIHNRIFSDLDIDWLDPIGALNKAQTKLLKNFYTELDKAAVHSVFKDPRLLSFAPHVELPVNASFILLTRNSKDISTSISRRNGFSDSKIQQYLQYIETCKAAVVRQNLCIIEVEYELLSSLKTATKLGEFLCVDAKLISEVTKKLLKNKRKVYILQLVYSTIRDFKNLKSKRLSYEILVRSMNRYYFLLRSIIRPN